jgi:urea carboxylase
VGIGGAYLCVYGMEGPGGYQFVGRTLQMWNRYRQTQDFREGRQWLLRFFDQVRFHEVDHDELLEMRAQFPLGRISLDIEETTLKLADYRKFIDDNADSIGAFKQAQQAAFEAERQRWEATGQANIDVEISEETASSDAPFEIPEGCMAIASPVTGSIWELPVKAGDSIATGDVLAVVEAMKMEIAIESDEDGQVEEVLCSPGDAVSAGQAILLLRLAE